jgi:hypothetical protein
VRGRGAYAFFASEIANEDLVPQGTPGPKGGDVVGWTGLLADELARGSSAERLRSYPRR